MNRRDRDHSERTGFGVIIIGGLLMGASFIGVGESFFDGVAYGISIQIIIIYVWMWFR